jgi:hypothetical protein
VDADNLLGAIVANAYNLLIIAVFAARLGGHPRLEYGLGLAAFSLVVPMVYLLMRASSTDRPGLYFLQLGLMIVFQLVELLLDYILEIDFRSVRWMTIAYVTLFFGATGGMIGVASHAGRGWTAVTGTTFLVMAGLAFYQRAKTGL